MQITLPSFDLSVPDEFVAKFPYSIPYQGSYILALLWVVKFSFRFPSFTAAEHVTQKNARDPL